MTREVASAEPGHGEGLVSGGGERRGGSHCHAVVRGRRASLQLG